jgi:hypothetical protein
LIKGYKKEEKQKYQGKITQTKALQMYAWYNVFQRNYQVPKLNSAKTKPGNNRIGVQQLLKSY